MHRLSASVTWWQDTTVALGPMWHVRACGLWIARVSGSCASHALNMTTTGKWMPRRKGARNADFIARLRKEWRALQRERPGAVRLRHVRSHVGVPGNELADWLAERGRHGEATSSDEAETWLSGWVSQRQRNLPAQDRQGEAPSGEG